MPAEVISLNAPRKTRVLNTPYEFLPAFEIQLAALLCCRPQFFGRIGVYIDPKLLSLPATKRAIMAAQDIERVTGRGPSAYMHVMQYLRRQMREGKCTLEELYEVNDMFHLVMEQGIMREDDVASEVIPLLKRRMQFDALTSATSSFVSGSGLQQACEKLGKALRVGDVDASGGAILSAENRALFNQARDRKSVV
jgi:hypothetical protein